jgi:polyhydroxybutyrate depolymerase
MRLVHASAISLAALLLVAAPAFGASASTQGSVPSAGCGTSEVDSGRHVETMQVGDLERTRVLTVPSAHDGETRLPLVILLHGGGLDPDSFISMTGFGDLAEEQGFVIVAPRSRDDPERWMWEPESAETDLTMANADLDFIDALVDSVTADLCVDLARIYATGWSMGGGGVSHSRFHDLRHAAATYLLSQGMTLEDVKNLLGHSSITLTSNTYGHVLEKRQHQVAQAMDVVLGG